MGQWLAEFLKNDGHEVVIADRDRDALKTAGHRLGVKTVASNAAAALGADYILLAVPLENLGATVEEISRQVREWQAVIDITSVKVEPVKIMHRRLKNSTILGAHPLFGPGARSIANKNFVLTPTREKEAALARKIALYLEERGGRVAVMTPRQHDEMMSLVLGLSHFLALVSADTLLSSGKLRPMSASGSSTYKVLLTMIESVLSEDPELYASIQMSLPNVTDFERLFREKTGEWADLVAEGNRGEFVRRMKSMKARLLKVAPDFEKSYEKLYRIVEGL